MTGFTNHPHDVKIGGRGKPDDTAVLELESTTKGFLKPRVTTLERLSMTPSEGLEVFDTDLGLPFVYGNGAWGSFVGIPSAGTSTDNAVVRWDGTSGAQLQDSPLVVDDLGNVTGALSVEAGNLKLEGNVISSTDTDGNITITPDGTGKVIISSDLQIDGTTTTVNSQTLDVADSNVTVNKGGNQASADTNDAGLTVEMTDATDAVVHYDSAATSKWKVGAVGATSEVLTVDHTQTALNKNISSGASIDSSLTIQMESTTKAAKPWPSMTTAQRDLISTISGATIFNTDTNSLEIYDGTDWLLFWAGAFFMIQDGYTQDFSSVNLTTTFSTIVTLAANLKEIDIVNNSGAEIYIRVTATGDKLIIGKGATRKLGVKGNSGEVVQIASVSGTVTSGKIYVNFLGV